MGGISLINLVNTRCVCLYESVLVGLQCAQRHVYWRRSRWWLIACCEACKASSLSSNVIMKCCWLLSAISVITLAFVSLQSWVVLVILTAVGLVHCWSDVFVQFLHWSLDTIFHSRYTCISYSRVYNCKQPTFYGFKWLRCTKACLI